MLGENRVWNRSFIQDCEKAASCGISRRFQKIPCLPLAGSTPKPTGKTPYIRTKKRPPQRLQLEEACAKNEKWGGWGNCIRTGFIELHA